jgi:hypothetical protein
MNPVFNKVFGDLLMFRDFLLKKKRSNKAHDFSIIQFILSFIWTISIISWMLLTVLQVIENRSLLAQIYLFSCMGLYLTGFKIFRERFFLSSFKIWDTPLKINHYLVNTLCTMGFIGGIFNVINAGGISGDLVATREEHIAKVYAGETHVAAISTYIEQYGLGIGLIGITLVFWTSQKLRNQISFLGLGLIGYLLSSLTSGGRVLITIAIVNTLLGLIFRKIKLIVAHKTLSLIGFSILIWGIIFFLVSWGASRGDLDAFALFAKKFGIYTDNVSNILEFIGIAKEEDLNYQLTNVFSTILYYLSSGIFNFQPFYDQYDINPLLGGYQFNIVSTSSIPLIGGHDWLSWKKDIEDIYKQSGLLSNVWGTFVRDFIIDFGFYLTPLFCFLTGSLSSYIEIKAFKSPAHLFLFIQLSVWVLVSPFYSLILLRPFQLSVMITIIWRLVEKLWLAKGKLSV